MLNECFSSEGMNVRPYLSPAFPVSSTGSPSPRPPQGDLGPSLLTFDVVIKQRACCRSDIFQRPSSSALCVMDAGVPRARSAAASGGAYAMCWDSLPPGSSRLSSECSQLPLSAQNAARHTLSPQSDFCFFVFFLK